MKIGPAKSRFWVLVAGTVAVAVAGWPLSGETAAAVPLSRVSRTAAPTTLHATASGPRTFRLAALPWFRLAISRTTSDGGTVSNFTARNISGGMNAHVIAYWEYMDIDHGPQFLAESFPGGTTWRFTRSDYWDWNREIRVTVVDQLTGRTASVTYRPIF